MTRRALLSDRALLALLARDVVSTAGSQMTWVALPWFVVTTTGSATKMAVVVAVEAAALGIVGFFASNFVGRLGLRRTMLVADACRAPLVAAVPVLHAAGLLIVSAAARARLCRRGIRHAVLRLEGVDPARDRRRGRRRAGRGECAAAGGDADRARPRTCARGRAHRADRRDERPLRRRGDVRRGIPPDRRASSGSAAPRPRPRSRAVSERVSASCSRTGCFARGRSRSWPATSRGCRSSSPCPCSSLHASESSPRSSGGFSAPGA